MPYVLIMAAFELGNPMMLLIFMEPHDAPLQGSRLKTGFSR